MYRIILIKIHIHTLLAAQNNDIPFEKHLLRRK